MKTMAEQGYSQPHGRDGCCHEKGLGPADNLKRAPVHTDLVRAINNLVRLEERAIEVLTKGVRLRDWIQDGDCPEKVSEETRPDCAPFVDPSVSVVGLLEFGPQAIGGSIERIIAILGGIEDEVIRLIEAKFKR